MSWSKTMFSLICPQSSQRGLNHTGYMEIILAYIYYILCGTFCTSYSLASVLITHIKHDKFYTNPWTRVNAWAIKRCFTLIKFILISIHYIFKEILFYSKIIMMIFKWTIKTNVLNQKAFLSDFILKTHLECPIFQYVYLYLTRFFVCIHGDSFERVCGLYGRCTCVH